MTIDKFNALGPKQASNQLRLCCVAERWIDAMLQGRPYADADVLLEQAHEHWQRLGEADYLQAFTGHPKIGDIHSLQKKYADSQTSAAHEQAGVNSASESVIEALAQGNATYEKKFGFIFIVCASGKAAAQMLALLQQRLNNDHSTELAIAATEQEKITALRLQKIIS